MRDAKSEAQKEIEEYKHQKEAEFKKFEAEVREYCIWWSGEDQLNPGSSRHATAY